LINGWQRSSQRQSINHELRRLEAEEVAEAEVLVEEELEAAAA
jgi:hypothetical protein